MEIITEPGTILFLLIIVTGGLVFYYLKLKYLQELARIEHGIISPPKDNNRFKKLGLVLISIGIAVFCGYLIGKFTDLHPLVTIPSMVLILSGCTLLIVNRIE